MEYITFTVLLHSQDSQLEAALRTAGFRSILCADGRDMRSFFEFALTQTDSDSFIKLDPADGFSVQDVAAVANALAASPQKVCVGTRKQEGKKPLPQTIYGFLSGVEIGDVESSLIGMSRENLEIMTHMKSRENCFAQNIILEAREKNIAVKTVPCDDTIASAPGWGLLTRSFKLYLVFIKFGIAAFLAYLVDIGTFYLFQKVFSGLVDEYKILVATVLSRILCSIATYLLNKGAVFNSHAKSTGTVIRFIILAIGQLIASWLLVWGLGYLLGGGDAVTTLLKVVVDFVIFMASFGIQRDWVFKESKSLLK